MVYKMDCILRGTHLRSYHSLAGLVGFVYKQEICHSLAGLVGFVYEQEICMGISNGKQNYIQPPIHSGHKYFIKHVK